MKFLIEILLSLTLLVVCCFQGWAVPAGVAGVLLGFGLYRYMLSQQLMAAVLKSSQTLGRR